jgi:hypothetical protein
MPSTAELVRVLEVVRLGYILPRFNGMDSMHDWASVLSLGEQQRLAFARLLLAKPTLVLLDESTSALDEANEVIILTLLLYLFSLLWKMLGFYLQPADRTNAITPLQRIKRKEGPDVLDHPILWMNKVDLHLLGCQL